ncbi:MAG: hypothetical protein ACXVCK_09295 [Bdellovibrionota bacterium]
MKTLAALIFFALVPTAHADSELTFPGTYESKHVTVVVKRLTKPQKWQEPEDEFEVKVDVKRSDGKCSFTSKDTALIRDESSIVTDPADDCEVTVQKLSEDEDSGVNVKQQGKCASICDAHVSMSETGLKKK